MNSHKSTLPFPDSEEKKADPSQMSSDTNALIFSFLNLNDRLTTSLVSRGLARDVGRSFEKYPLSQKINISPESTTGIFCTNYGTYVTGAKAAFTFSSDDKESQSPAPAPISCLPANWATQVIGTRNGWYDFFQMAAVVRRVNQEKTINQEAFFWKKEEKIHDDDISGTGGRLTGYTFEELSKRDEIVLIRNLSFTLL